MEINRKKQRILRKAWKLSGYTKEDELNDEYDIIKSNRILMLLAYNTLTRQKFIWKLKEIEIARLIHDSVGMFSDIRSMQINDSSILRHKKFIKSTIERVPEKDVIYLMDTSPVLNKMLTNGTK